jgi:hypothetical protein
MQKESTNKGVCDVMDLSPKTRTTLGRGNVKVLCLYPGWWAASIRVREIRWSLCKHGTQINSMFDVPSLSLSLCPFLLPCLLKHYSLINLLP